MGLRDDLKKVTDNVKDALDEAAHRGAAEAERQDRELNDDLLTPGERLRSVGNEAKHEVLAEVDKLKRDVRSNA